MTNQEIKHLSKEIQKGARMGGFTKVVDVPVTVQASPNYADGDVIGSLLEIDVSRFDANNSGIIQSMSLINDATTDSIEIYLFNDSITPAVDNTAFAPSASDLKKMIPGGFQDFGTLTNIGSANYGFLTGVNIPYNVTGTKLYAVLIANATINFAAVNDLHLRVSLLMD